MCTCSPSVAYIPGDGDALDLHPWEGDGGLPVLWAGEDEVVERVAEVDVLAEVGVGLRREATTMVSEKGSVG